MSKIIEDKISGVLFLEGSAFQDDRGELHKPLYNSIIPGFKADEVYYIISKKNVLRGMHFQLPPFEQGKFIYVAKGKILDVIVDLRKNSPTFGQSSSFSLSAGDNRAVYVPPGCAHGYLTLEEESVIHYVQSGNYSREHERGIRFDSFGFNWPVKFPVVSEKDSLLPELSQYQSPF
ncbi:MAG: dTDP-4-dehydrorhamnose 3,5-epimerase family protein [Bacteriovoracaceae bacterium]|jgi:dTDP-4-dehydrorhamnose 3,5-epimerase